MQSPRIWQDHEGNYRISMGAILEPDAPRLQGSRPGYGYYSYPQSPGPVIHADGRQAVQVTALVDTPEMSVNGQRGRRRTSTNGGEGMHPDVQGLLLALAIVAVLRLGQCDFRFIGPIDLSNLLDVNWNNVCYGTPTYHGTYGGTNVYTGNPRDC